MLRLKFKFNIYLNFKMFSFLSKNRIQITPKLREYCIKSTNESIRKLSEKYNQERNLIKKEFKFAIIKKEDSAKDNYIDLIITFLSSISFLCFLKKIFLMTLPSSYYYVSNEIEYKKTWLSHCLPTKFFPLDTSLDKTNIIHERKNEVIVKQLVPQLVPQSEQEPVLTLVNIKDSYDIINIVADNIDTIPINLEPEKKIISTESSDNVNSKIIIDWVITDFSQELN